MALSRVFDCIRDVYPLYWRGYLLSATARAFYHHPIGGVYRAINKTEEGRAHGPGDWCYLPVLRVTRKGFPAAVSG
jgi:hypothetical protein